jgi:uncharacterized protein
MDQENVGRTIEQFKHALETAGIHIDRIILFGSQADGTAIESSDIDLIVISPSFAGKSYWERIDILSEAIYEVFAPIEATAFTPEEWQSGQSLMVDYAREGVLVG